MSKVIGWWCDLLPKSSTSSTDALPVGTRPATDVQLSRAREFFRARELWQRIKPYLLEKSFISRAWIWEIDVYLAIQVDRDQVYKAFRYLPLHEHDSKRTWDRKQWEAFASRIRPLGPTCTQLLGYVQDTRIEPLYRRVCPDVQWQNHWHPHVHWTPTSDTKSVSQISWKYISKFFQVTKSLARLGLLLTPLEDAKVEPQILHLNQSTLPPFDVSWSPDHVSALDLSKINLPFTKSYEPSNLQPSPLSPSTTHVVLDLSIHAPFLMSPEGLWWILSTWMHRQVESDPDLVSKNENCSVHLAVHRPKSQEPVEAKFIVKPKTLVLLNATTKLAHEARLYFKPHFNLAHFEFVSPEETKFGHWDTKYWFAAHSPSHQQPAVANGGVRFSEVIEPILLQHHQTAQQAAMYLHHDPTWTANDMYTVQSLQHLKLGEFKCALPQSLPLPFVYPVRKESLLTPWRRDPLSLTIVTGIFAIRRRETHHTEPKDSVKSVDQYLHHAQRLLDWPVSMIIFTEPEFAAKIMHERAKRGFLNQTMVYPMCLEQSRFWPAVAKLQDHYEKGRVPQGFCKQKDSALYVWAQATKYDCLLRALRLNPWKSQSMYWVDFGIYHVAVPPDDTMALLQQMNRAKRLRVTHLRTLNKTEIQNKPQFWSRLQQAAAGGLIGGPLAQVQWLAQEFEREFSESLEHFPVLDEAILGSLCMQFPDRFAPIWSGHHEMFRLRSTRHTLQMMQAAAREKNWLRVWDLAFELPSGTAKELAEHMTKEQMALRAKLLLQSIELINTGLDASDAKALIVSLQV